MKVKIEVAVFKMKSSGDIFIVQAWIKGDDIFQSSEESELIGFRLVEVEV